MSELRRLAGLHLADVGLHRFDFPIDEAGDIDPVIRLKGILWKGRRDVSRRWNFVAKKLLDLVIRDRPARDQRSLQHRAVVLIRIAAMVGVYDVGTDPRDAFLQRNDDVEHPLIEQLVAQIEKLDLVVAEDLCGAAGGGFLFLIDRRRKEYECGRRLSVLALRQ